MLVVMHYSCRVVRTRDGRMGKTRTASRFSGVLHPLRRHSVSSFLFLFTRELRVEHVNVNL